MVEIFRLIQTGWDAQNAGGQYMGVFLAAVLFLFIVESKKNKQLFLYCLLGLLLLWNPLTAGLLIRFFDFEEEYQQAFLLLPLIPVCAYCGTNAVFLQDNKKDKTILLCGLLFVCAIAGRLMNPETELERKENNACIKEEYRQFFEFMLEGDEMPVLLAGEEIMESARAYSSELQLPYETSFMAQEEVWQQLYGEELHHLYKQMKKPVNLLGGITQTARRYGCNYLILPLEADDRAAMENGGYLVISENEEHVLYKDLMLQ